MEEALAIRHVVKKYAQRISHAFVLPPENRKILNSGNKKRENNSKLQKCIDGTLKNIYMT